MVELDKAIEINPEQSSVFITKSQIFEALRNATSAFENDKEAVLIGDLKANQSGEDYCKYPVIHLPDK